MANKYTSPPTNVDYGTRNKSFLKMYKYLKDMGIKNNKFFLRLYDSALIGVNPHDANLSIEMQARIQTEVQKNPWYYLREVVRIPVPGGIKSFELHRGNLPILWGMLNNLNILCELPRQNYKTISAICLYVWVYEYCTENTTILFGNKSFDDSKLNIARFKNIRDCLPKYLVISDRKDKDNIEEIKSVKNNNTLQALSNAIDAAQADKLGRGCTVSMFYWVTNYSPMNNSAPLVQ